MGRLGDIFLTLCEASWNAAADHRENRLNRDNRRRIEERLRGHDLKLSDIYKIYAGDGFSCTMETSKQIKIISPLQYEPYAPVYSVLKPTADALVFPVYTLENGQQIAFNPHIFLPRPGNPSILNKACGAFEEIHLSENPEQVRIKYRAAYIKHLSL